MWGFLREMTMMKTTTTTTMVMVTAPMSMVMVAATATTNLKSQVHIFPISYVTGKDHESFLRFLCRGTGIRAGALVRHPLFHYRHPWVDARAPEERNAYTFEPTQSTL